MNVYNHCCNSQINGLAVNLYQSIQWAPRGGGSDQKRKKCYNRRTTKNCHGDQIRCRGTGDASCRPLGGASLVALRALEEYKKINRGKFGIRLN